MQPCWVSKGEAAHGMIDAASGTLSDDDHGMRSLRNVCTCHAMPCHAMPCQAATFYVLGAHCVYILVGFPFSRRRTAAQVAVRTLPVIMRDLPFPWRAPINALAHVRHSSPQKIRRPSRKLNDGSTQRPCLGFPPLCPEFCPLWGKLIRVPARGQGPL